MIHLKEEDYLCSQMGSWKITSREEKKKKKKSLSDCSILLRYERIYEESLQINHVSTEANPKLLLKETMYVSNKIWGV